jgi:CBS domain-containing protein
MERAFDALGGMIMAQGKKVKDVMSKDVVVARPDMTIREVAEIMRSRDLGSLPVIEDDCVCGIVTDRDITIRATAQGMIPDEIRAQEVMSEGAITVDESAPLEEAERIMHDQQLRRLPVVDADGKLVGYLSQARIARTEDAQHAGKLLKGISQSAKPAPLESSSPRRRRKTG